MSVFSTDKKNDPLNLQYMGEVDAALHMRGHPYAFILSLSVVGFFVVFALWASFATMDNVTRGMGQVIPAEGVFMIQNERGGVVTSILVKESEKVKKDQLVGMLSNTIEEGTFRDLQNKNIELALAIVRLEAEALGHELVYTADIEKAYSDVVRSQRQLFVARRQQFLGEVGQLEAQIEQREQEVKEAQNRSQQLTDSLALLRERESHIRPLVGTAVTKIEFLELQSEIVTKEGEFSSMQQTIARAESGVLAAKEHLNNRESEWQTNIAEELNKNRMELATITENIKVSKEQVANMDLRSPVDGTVNRVLVKEKSVARPTETIMEIIPSDGTLEIEAKFKPQDRGFLFVDQGAMIKFTAYDFSIFGGLEAKITRISQDTIEDKKGDAWYEVRFVTKKPALIYRGEALEIHPGMTVSIDVLGDKMTVLDAMLKPIKAAFSDAMTER